VPGIYGVDTRAVTKLIREQGAIPGRVVVQGSGNAEDFAFEDPNETNIVAGVCRQEPQTYAPASLGEGAATKDGGQEPVHVLAVDCGMKNNIVRYFVDTLRVKLTVVPFDFDFTSMEFDGLFLSNGPGNPEKCSKTVEHVKKFMAQRPNTPIFGICLGNQILSLAAGASTYKMKFGNRGMNQPCIDLRTMRCYITPQNHGFAVDASSRPAAGSPS
jgi:carbamoyl-phosphate synthase small subunit